MPFSNLPQGGGGDFNWFAAAMMLLLSLWGGLVNYLGKLKSGVVKRFDVIELIAELSICSFAGIVIGFVAMSFNVHPLMAFALAAVAGHAGGRTVYFLDRFYQKRLAALANRKFK